jgi:hypothetical protein
MEDRGAAGLVGLAEVKEAAKRIDGKAHITPILTCAALDALTGGRSIFFKCENLQKVPIPQRPVEVGGRGVQDSLTRMCASLSQVGAFKIRGACNAVFKLTDDEARNGVVTHSSGNHAQGAPTRPLPLRVLLHLGHTHPHLSWRCAGGSSGTGRADAGHSGLHRDAPLGPGGQEARRAGLRRARHRLRHRRVPPAHRFSSPLPLSKALRMCVCGRVRVRVRCETKRVFFSIACWLGPRTV